MLFLAQLIKVLSLHRPEEEEKNKQLWGELKNQNGGRLHKSKSEAEIEELHVRSHRDHAKAAN